MSYHSIDAWEIECEKNTIKIFPEYLRSNHINKLIEFVKKDYFLGKKLKFFCLKKEKDDINYLGWIDEMLEKEKDDGILPPQIQGKIKKNLVEDKLEDEESEENEINENSEQTGRGKLLEKVIQLEKEVITLLEKLLDEKRKSLKKSEKQKNNQEIEELKGEINQLEKELNQKKQELEKLLNYREEISIKV